MRPRCPRLACELLCPIGPGHRILCHGGETPGVKYMKPGGSWWKILPVSRGVRRGWKTVLTQAWSKGEVSSVRDTRSSAASALLNASHIFNRHSVKPT